MFIRRKLNKSGSISIQIIKKENRRNILVKTIGCSKDPKEIARLQLRGEEFINKPIANQCRLFRLEDKESMVIKNFLSNLSNSNIHTVGPELIFGKLFDKIGFNQISDELFRHLVITRLAYPTSKLKTVDYLYRYKGIKINITKLYRFLDKLHSKYKEQAEQIAFEYTKKKLKNISVVFYDMTTLYFEAEDEDDLRRIGFSKDGKFQKPQIMLGLLVGKKGLPIGYDIFEGNTFEGNTLLPILDQIQKKYHFSKPVVIADSGLLSKKNLSNLSQQKYQFILGGRIKNESERIKEQILEKAQSIKNGDSFVIKKTDGLKLVISYSDQRAKKDNYNREKGLRKLRQKASSGKLTKENINNRGYNKFLKLKSEVLVEIDEEKVQQDKVWDGLKGYVTNTKLSSKDIIENYKHLWQIEKAFRISKTDLKVRPIYHRKRNRIEAHICIAFVAYAIYKELERLLCKYQIGLSVKRAAELTHNMYRLNCKLPHQVNVSSFLLNMDSEQKLIYELIKKSYG